VNRSTPGAFGFFTLIQDLLGPDRYGSAQCFETMPSKPSLQAREDGRPSPSMCLILYARVDDVPHEMLEPAPSLLQCLDPQVDSAQFQQVEGVEEDAVVVRLAV
jgi:hypothetical protein